MKRIILQRILKEILIPQKLLQISYAKKMSFVEGIENVFKNVKGSCSILILTDDGIIAARDKLGRTPVVIGKKDGALAVASKPAHFRIQDLKSNTFLVREKLFMLNLMDTLS